VTRNIQFGRPILGETEQRAMAEVLSGTVLTHGARCAAFEKRFAERLGVKHAITTSNCTTALHLTLVAHGIGPGDEVIVPAMTHVATAHVVEHCGARPVFVDVDRSTGNIDPAKIAAAVGAKTKAVMVVHFIGLPCDMDAVRDAARGLPVIEDCATALGATYGEELPGAIGAVGCFSFYPAKHITTLEGGMLTTNDDVIADLVRKQRAFGYDKNFGERSVPGVYDIAMLGWNYRMSEGHAAVGLCQMDRLDGFLVKRFANADVLIERLERASGAQVFPMSAGKANSARYCVNVTLPATGGPDRLALIRALNADGIGTSVHYPVALPLSKYYRSRYPAAPNDFPIADWIANRTISLPCAPHLDEEDMAYIGDRFLAHYSKS
jgi:perosamine synthetase